MLPFIFNFLSFKDSKLWKCLVCLSLMLLMEGFKPKMTGAQHAVRMEEMKKYTEFYSGNLVRRDT